MRIYGAPLTTNARGALGVDPLLVAAPAIGLLAGAVLAIRIVPRLAQLAERLLEPRRGLVLPLTGQQIARRPLRYTRTALLLMLAASLGTFAAVVRRDVDPVAGGPGGLSRRWRSPGRGPGLSVHARLGRRPVVRIAWTA